MILVLALLIVVAVAFVVAYPLWKPGPAAKASPEPNDQLLAQKETTYTALKELEFDYALGNLTPEDHEALEEKYKDRAVSILKQLDERSGQRPKQSSVEEKLEAEILELRRSARKAQQAAKGPGPRTSGAQQRQTTQRPQAQNACPKCRSAIPVGARYCPYCGSSIAAMVCARCSAPYHTGERFCSQCGAPLGEEREK